MARNHEAGQHTSAARGSGLSPRRLGMRLFLVSLGILFGASLIGYLVVRVRADEWPPPGTPELPAGLWVSTAILVVLSAVLVVAVRNARAARTTALSQQLAAASALGIAFLAAQTGNWMGIAAGAVVPRQSLFLFAFYVLTFLHAVHVLAGVVPLVLVTLRARQGRYVDDPEPIELVASYWHFLGAAWLAIFAVLSI
jgi:heme/copper-type cytochrome/quinol oxidase subunit 3